MKGLSEHDFLNRVIPHLSLGSERNQKIEYLKLMAEKFYEEERLEHRGGLFGGSSGKHLPEHKVDEFIQHLESNTHDQLDPRDVKHIVETVRKNIR